MNEILYFRMTEDQNRPPKVEISISHGQTTFLVTAKEEISEIIKRTLLGFIAPPGFTVSLFGEDPSKLSTHELLGLRQRVGVVFAKHGLIANLPVLENVLLPIQLRKRLAKSEADQAGIDALEKVGYSGSVMLPPSKLSLLQKKQVMLARILLTRPEIIIYNSVFNGLARSEQEKIVDVIINLQSLIGNPAALFLTSDPANVSLLPKAEMITIPTERIL